MPKKFSIANIIVKPSVRSTRANDIGQAVQVAANVIGSIAKNKKQKQAENDQSAYFQANIEYRNQTVQHSENMLVAGNDLGKQREELDTYNEDVSNLSKQYKLNEQYTSQFSSTVFNDMSKREQSYRTKKNRQDRNIVESNITDVIANTISMGDGDFIKTAKDLKAYAISQNFTPQEASQMIAKAYINSKIAGIDPENITFEQANLMLTEVKENLVAYDDRIISDLIYKQGVAAFTGIAAKVKGKEEADFRAIIKSSSISPRAMNDKIDFEVGRGIFSKDGGDLLKKQYKDRIRIETAAAKAREIALGVKGKKAIKELEQPIKDNFNNIINEMQSKDAVPVEITPEYLRNMMIYTVNTDATKAVLSTAQMTYLNDHEIAYKMKYDINAREQVIASNSLAYANSVHKGRIQKELGLSTTEAFSQTGDMNTVEAIWRNHNVRGEIDNIISFGLQDENTLGQSLAAFADLDSRGIADSMLDTKTFLRATVYDFLSTTNEEENLVVPPDVKKIADGYIQNPATIEVSTADMKAFNDVFGTTGSGNHTAKRREFRLLVAMGANSKELAVKMLEDDKAYKPIEGVDLTGMRVDLSKKQDEIAEALDYYKSIGFTGYSYKETEGLIYLSKDGDRWNRSTGHTSIDGFLNEVQTELNLLRLPVIKAADKFRVQERERRKAVYDKFIEIFFRKPTDEQIRAFTQSAGR